MGTKVDIGVWTGRRTCRAAAELTGSVVTGLLVALGMLSIRALELAGGMRFCANAFDRGRLARWERDWDRVAPLWLPL